MLPIRSLRDWTVHGLWLKTIKEAPWWFAEARFTSFEERWVWVCSEIHTRQRGRLQARLMRQILQGGMAPFIMVIVLPLNNSQPLPWGRSDGHSRLNALTREAAAISQKGSQTIKDPKSTLRVIPKDWMWCKGMQQIRACGKRHSQTSQPGEVLVCSQLAWTGIHWTLSFMEPSPLRRPEEINRTMLGSWERWYFLLNLSFCHFFSPLFLFFYFFLSLPLTHIYC